jgi:hypothetical protein
MKRFIEGLDLFISLAKLGYGIFASIVVDTWSEGNRIRLGSRTLCCSDVSVNAGDSIVPYGWLDMAACGRPVLTIEMLTTGYDRDIRVETQYGQRVYAGMYVVLRQRDRNSGPVEYSPNTGIFQIRLSRDRGRWVRIKEIQNKSSGTVTISAWTQSTIKPLLEDILTTERDTIEGD